MLVFSWIAVSSVFLTTILLCAGSVSNSYPWRTSIDGTCWNDVSCRRALIVSHGGSWTVTEPYDSFPAFERAFSEGTDSVKGDYRVSSDGVGVVVHSSPLAWYESANCDGRYVENMTAQEITEHCKMYLTEHHFITVKKLLDWAKDKVIVMLCIKDFSDIQHAIETLIDCDATTRAFLEIPVDHLTRLVPPLKNWEKVWYLAEGHGKNDIQGLLSFNNTELLKRSFTFEFDSSDWNISLPKVIKEFHSRGIRTLMPTKTHLMPSVKEQEEIFDSGIDVVYSYDTKTGVKARTNVDIHRGIVPP